LGIYLLSLVNYFINYKKGFNMQEFETGQSQPDEGERLNEEEAQEDASIVNKKLEESDLDGLIETAKSDNNLAMLSVLQNERRELIKRESDRLAAERKDRRTQEAVAKHEKSAEEERVNGLVADIMKEALQAARGDSPHETIIYDETRKDSSLATNDRRKALKQLRDKYISPAPGGIREYKHDRIEGTSFLTTIPNTWFAVSYWRGEEGHKAGSLASASLGFNPNSK
jgi:hypothetical protein